MDKAQEWLKITMRCYFCRVESGRLELKEHEAARWLEKDRFAC